MPEEPPKPDGGRSRVDDRAALIGIIFVLKSGIPWEMLPQEMGCGNRVTCWRRLCEWHQAGVWEELHRVLLNRLGEAELIHWRPWPTKETARSVIFEYLEAFYNRRRLHSALGYASPVAYEEATTEGAG